MNAQPQIWLVPGLGADARLFEGLRRAGLEFQVLEFIRPEIGESLADYARRLAEPIDTSRPFVIGGVSLGGMLSMEIARFTEPEKVLLISSVKSSREFPFYFKVFRYLPVHRVLSGNFMKKYAPRESRRHLPEWQSKALEDMRREADPWFVSWAVNAAVRWRFRESPDNVIHIHGTSDAMFPGLFLGERIKVKKGNHIMVLARAEEVTELIRESLEANVLAGQAVRKI